MDMTPAQTRSGRTEAKKNLSKYHSQAKPPIVEESDVEDDLPPPKFQPNKRRKIRARSPSLEEQIVAKPQQ